MTHSPLFSVNVSSRKKEKKKDQQVDKSKSIENVRYEPL